MNKEYKEILRQQLRNWEEKILIAYDFKAADATMCADTYKMLADVDKILAEAFQHDTVLE